MAKSLSIFLAYIVLLFSSASLHAIVFSVDEITTADHVFSSATPVDVYTPTGLNPMQSFKTSDGTVYDIENWYAIKVLEGGIAPSAGLQYKGSTDPLFDDFSKYMWDGGDHGLATSTGIRVVTKNPIQVLNFPVFSVNAAAIGDGLADLFVLDVANVQSLDDWALLDADGNTIATLTTGNDGDWTQVGRQNLDHAITDENGKPGEVKDVGSRAISGMALELSDFTLTAEHGGGQLTSEYADQIVAMTLLIGGSDPDGPKTDMGFIASDITSISFTNQVPESRYYGLLLGLCILSRVITRRRR